MAELAQTFPILAFEDFERIESTTDHKLEFLHGAIYMMAGAPPRHNLLVGNCIWLLRSALAPGKCFVLSSDQHVVTPQNQADFLPDVVVVCEASIEKLPYRIQNPTVVVEVLSPSTRNHDLGAKLLEYQRIPSLRSILYLDSETATARLWQRPESSTWPSEPQFFQSGDSLIGLSIGVSLALRDLYEGTGLL
jgi:Uma2 family endonuclease